MNNQESPLERYHKMASVAAAAVALIAVFASLVIYPFRVRENSADIDELQDQVAELSQIQTDLAVIKNNLEWVTETLRSHDLYERNQDTDRSNPITTPGSN